MVEDTYYVVYYNPRTGEPIHYSRSYVQTLTVLTLVTFPAIAVVAFLIWPNNITPPITTLLLGFIFLAGHLARVDRGRKGAAEYKARKLTDDKPT